MTGGSEKESGSSLDDFLEKFPFHLFPAKDPEIIRRGPERYGPLDPEKEGTWRVILSNRLPVAVAWTDWEEGFGIYVLLDTEVTSRLQTYQISAKETNIPAPWAYTTLEEYLSGLDLEDQVTLEAPREGKLSGVYSDPGVPSSGTLQRKPSSVRREVRGPAS